MSAEFLSRYGAFFAAKNAEYADDAFDRNAGALSGAAEILAIARVAEPETAAVEEPAAPVYASSDFTGAGYSVVVVDTGWNTQFLGPDEAPIAEYDFYSDDPDAEVATWNDHGSWVDQVVRTVADGVEIIHLKVFSDDGGYATFGAVEQALDWVVANAEAYNVAAVNLSLGAGNVTSEVFTSLSDEIAALDAIDVLTIVAAGNSGQDGVQILAADPNAVAVSASDGSGQAASFTQADAELTDIFAFGAYVPIADEWGRLAYVSGTSFSAPYVSGAAARLQEAAEVILSRRLEQDEFIDILQGSGDVLNDPEAPIADGYVIADADAAVQTLIDLSSDLLIA